LKVFLDTNVLASGIATRGLCSELLECVIHDHELPTCQPVLRELEGVLIEKLRLPEAVVAGSLALLKAEGTLSPATNTSAFPAMAHATIAPPEFHRKHRGFASGDVPYSTDIANAHAWRTIVVSRRTNTPKYDAKAKVDAFDWPEIIGSLDADGTAVLPRLLDRGRGHQLPQRALTGE